MSEKEKRERIIKFRVSESEYEKICKVCKESGFANLSDYIRIVAIRRCVFLIEKDELVKIRKFITSVSNNVNQIAMRVNSTGKIYAEDLEEIKEGVRKIWQRQASILLLLHKQEQ